MDLKSIISKPKGKKESYWTLLIESGWISAAIWEVLGDQVNVVAQGPAARWSDDLDLINAVDTALSSCVTNLPEEYEEPEKTVFGLPSSWIKDGDIKPEYLEKLKKVCNDLSLSPSGFVILSEAIAHHKKVEEGSPLSAVLVGLSDENLEVSLFKMGKLAGSFDVARSVSIADDLVEGLARFGSDEVFPSRIIVYDGKEADLEDVRSNLTEASWNEIEKIKFLHTPKVDVVKPDEKTIAVSLAGGAEIAGVDKVAADNVIDTGDGDNKEEESEQEETEKDKVPEDAGNVVQPEKDLTAEDLGFVVGGEAPLPQKTKAQVPPASPVPETPVASTPEQKSHKMPKFQLPSFNIPKPKMGKFSAGSKKPLIIGGVALVTLLICGFLFWWFYSTARVIVYVAPKNLDENTQLALGEDFSASDVSVSVSGEKTKSTSGTKLVGEKAKGSVRIQNGTANVINLDSGTVLSSSSDLSFTLDKSASISAALSPSSPGTATVEVTAADIGPEYNLAKDEVFKIGNYPKADVDAVSTDDFSGGSSRQISAVSDEDIEELEENLTSELLDEARQKLEGDLSSDQILIDSSLDVDVETSDFSNKSGDEASTLKLNLSLDVAGKVISKADLSESAKELLEDKVPSGFVLRDDQIEYEFESDSEDDNLVDVNISANLLPNIDTVQVTDAIVGKYLDLAEEYLSNVPGFVNAEFKVKPMFPGKLGTLPHVAKRIEVEISAAR